MQVVGERASIVILFVPSRMLHADVLTRGNVYVEYEPQTRIEGDIQQMAPDFPVTELWQVISANAPRRRDEAGITLFDSVGFALGDYSALTFIRDTAAKLGVGDIVQLIPESHDPKNLFGVLDMRTAKSNLEALA